MAEYSVHFYCDECGDVHPLHIVFSLDDGPVKQSSIGDVYDGKPLPTEIATLEGNMTTCPKTGKLTSQKDNNQVYLVPLG